jgi:hypothetical protein
VGLVLELATEGAGAKSIGIEGTLTGPRAPRTHFPSGKLPLFVSPNRRNVVCWASVGASAEAAMSHDYHKKGLLAAAAGAVVLGTLVLWGALYELSGKSNSDGQTVSSAASQKRP